MKLDDLANRDRMGEKSAKNFLDGIEASKQRDAWRLLFGLGIFHVGAGVAKALDKTGHRVLHTSVSQPYFPLIMDRAFTPTQIEAVQKALRALPETEAGQSVLKNIGIQGFDTSTEKRLRELLAWLGL